MMFKKLFGWKEKDASQIGVTADKAGKTTSYGEYEVIPRPMRQGAHFLTAGVVQKRFGEELKQHNFIRADHHTDWQSACDHALNKGKQIIDEQGDRMFDSTKT